MVDELGLFLGKDKPDRLSGWQLYDEAKKYNNSINLYDNVKVN